MNSKKLLCLALAFVLLLCGCGSAADPTESEVVPTAPDNTVMPTAVPTTAPVETTEPGLMGYSFEEANELKGLFYILEDGSFARYWSGGFKMYAGIYDYGRDTLYVPRGSVDSNPVLSQKDTIVIFSDVNISVDIQPVAASGKTVSLTSDDELVILNPIYSPSTREGITHYHAIMRESKDDTTISLIGSTEEHLFGVPLEEIEYTRYEKSYGKIRGIQENFDSFPGDENVTISLVEGTKVNQFTAIADYYFYMYGDYYTRYNESLPIAEVNAIPTVEGYAAVKLENVPAGQYVMIVSMEDNTYYGTTLTVE